MIFKNWLSLYVFKKPLTLALIGLNKCKKPLEGVRWFSFLLSLNVQMFWFKITFTSCFTMEKPHRWGGLMGLNSIIALDLKCFISRISSPWGLTLNWTPPLFCINSFKSIHPSTTYGLIQARVKTWTYCMFH